MARRGKKKGRPVSGWVILDKPVGMGSTEAVSKIKWLFQAEKAGHAGTLDPLASGMLPIALGEATKTVPYVMDGTKVYRFTVAWGEERSTDDLEGPVTKTSGKRPDESAIRALLPKYTGVILQTPPQFSAIKIAGERAYDLARDGETVEIPPREVEIDRLDLVGVTPEGHAIFEVECGKGTYVRSLARDMGRDLGCYGHVAGLRRIEVDPFTPEDLVTVEALEVAAPAPYKPDADDSDDSRPRDAKARYAELDALLVDTGAALEYLPHVALTDDAAARIRLGNPVIIRGRDAPVEAEEAFATARGKLVAIGAIEAGMFKPRRVFGG
ncbi:MAG TPA: tRNA pseudouridine(55) synthase TruB [Mesorhizobium sp.]|nr:tRNA pseudouridine(55) synthase TruB [Mesorhizobium sp.]